MRSIITFSERNGRPHLKNAKPSRTRSSNPNTSLAHGTDDIDVHRAHVVVSVSATGTPGAATPTAVAPAGGIVVTTSSARSSPPAGPPPPSLPVPATLGASGRPGAAGEPVVARELLKTNRHARAWRPNQTTTTPRGAGTGPNENEGQREGKGIAETRTRTDVLACSSRSAAGDAAAVASAPGAAAGAGAPVMAGEAKGEGKEEIKWDGSRTISASSSLPRRPLPTARIAAGGAREKVGGPPIRAEKIQKWGGLAGWLAGGLTKAHR